MFEKVNPSHPDKVADRVAGAIVDLAYKKKINPKIAVEVLLGHNEAFVILETDTHITKYEVKKILKRIAGITKLRLIVVEQDPILNSNQQKAIRCGDNGIFKGVPVTSEQKELTKVVGNIYAEVPSDGKYILDGSDIIVCQSNASKAKLEAFVGKYKSTINPLGDWTGGLDVDSGATNRKLGSDMGDAVTGGGLHGKDLSKADVSVNIYCHLKAQQLGRTYQCKCAIGDEYVDGKPYAEIVEIARNYIANVGGFEKFAEWGLIRP